MKKIISLILSVIFVLSMCTFSFAETIYIDDNLVSIGENKNDNVKETPKSDYKDKLVALGIVEENSSYEQFISRGDFLKIALKMLNMEFVYSGEQIFADVPPSHDSFKTVGVAHGLGLISGFGGFFRPDENITYEEVIVIMVKLLGRNTSAEEKGGWSEGYITAATSFKILSGFTISDFSAKAEREDVYKIVWNTLISDSLAVTDSFLHGEVNYTTKKGRNLLSEVMGVNYIDGLVTSVGISSILSNDGADYSKVVVDGFSFDGEYSKYIDYLGLDVRAYYTGKSAADYKLLYLDEEFGNSKITVVPAEDVLDFANDEFTYYEKNKQKSFKVFSDTSIMYNGRLANGFSKADIPKNGTVTFIDNGAADDVVLIKGVTDIVVGAVMEDTGIVYDYFDKDVDIDLISNDSEDVIVLTNSAGKTVYAGMIFLKDILTVTASKDGKIVEAIVNSSSVSGKIEQVEKSNNKKIISVNGTEYEITDKAEKFCGDVLKLGNDVTLKFNIYGQVAYAQKYEDDTKENEIKYGFIVNHAPLSASGLSSEYAVKLLCDDGKMYVYSFAENCKIDGFTRKTNADKESAINKGLEISRVTNYKLNSEGKITFFDTAYISGEESKKNSLDRFEQIADEDSSERRTYKAFGCFGEVFFIDPAKTLVFATISGQTQDEKKYKLFTPSVFNNDGKYSVDAFKTAEEGFLAEAVTVTLGGMAGSQNAQDASLYILESITKKVVDDEDVCVYSVNKGKGSVSVIVDNETHQRVNPSPGDLIRIDVVEGSLLNGQMHIVYDYSEDLLVEGNQHPTSSIIFRKGFIKEKSGDYYKYMCTDNVADLESDVQTNVYASVYTNEVEFASYEIDRNGQVIVSSASMSNLKPFDMVGNDASKIVGRWSFLNPKQIIIIGKNDN